MLQGLRWPQGELTDQLPRLVVLGVLHDITTLDFGAVHHGLIEGFIPLRLLELVDSDGFQGVSPQVLALPAANTTRQGRKKWAQ